MEKENLTQLVKAVQRGDEAAITELYNRYHQDIYYYILKTLDPQADPELAADLTQDTFIEIIQTIDNLQNPSAFPAWSKKIAYHKCTAYFRKRHELLADEQEDGSTIFDTLVEEREEFIPAEALDKEAFRKTIQEMIDALPEEQRSAIMMRYYNELSVAEIAQIQGTTEGTVKSRLNYGRKAIKNAVESYEKKHDIKLHCAGIIPLLLWLFREQKRAQAAAQPVLAASMANAAKSIAAASAKAAARVLATKIIAGVTAAAVSAGALGFGISLLVKNKQTPPEALSSQQSQDVHEPANTPDTITEDISDYTEPETPPAETPSDAYDLADYPAYVQKVGEYRAAIFCEAGAFSEDLYPTLNTHMLHYYHIFDEDACFFYALLDIDSNNTPELLIGKAYSATDTPSIIDLYSISEDTLVQYFENPSFGERVYLSILEGGLLQESGSSGASSGGCSIYQISANGDSVSTIADYTYYIPDEFSPPPEEGAMTYEAYQAAVSQYSPYTGDFLWCPIDN